jgi:hypothetical protein
MPDFLGDLDIGQWPGAIGSVILPLNQHVVLEKLILARLPGVHHLVDQLDRFCLIRQTHEGCRAGSIMNMVDIVVMIGYCIEKRIEGDW